MSEQGTQPQGTSASGSGGVGAAILSVAALIGLYYQNQSIALQNESIKQMVEDRQVTLQVEQATDRRHNEELHPYLLFQDETHTISYECKDEPLANGDLKHPVQCAGERQGRHYVAEYGTLVNAGGSAAQQIKVTWQVDGVKSEGRFAPTANVMRVRPHVLLPGQEGHLNSVPSFFTMDGRRDEFIFNGVVVISYTDCENRSHCSRQRFHIHYRPSKELTKTSQCDVGNVSITFTDPVESLSDAGFVSL